jgi:hypothetical protein
MSLSCGAQPHTVIEDFCCRAAAIAAAFDDALAELEPEPELLLEHAVNPAAARAPTARTVAPRRHARAVRVVAVMAVRILPLLRVWNFMG